VAVTGAMGKKKVMLTFHVETPDTTPPCSSLQNKPGSGRASGFLPQIHPYSTFLLARGGGGLIIGKHHLPLDGNQTSSCMCVCVQVLWVT